MTPLEPCACPRCRRQRVSEFERGALRAISGMARVFRELQAAAARDLAAIGRAMRQAREAEAAARRAERERTHRRASELTGGVQRRASWSEPVRVVNTQVKFDRTYTGSPLDGRSPLFDLADRLRAERDG